MHNGEAEIVVIGVCATLVICSYCYWARICHSIARMFYSEYPVVHPSTPHIEVNPETTIVVSSIHDSISPI